MTAVKICGITEAEALDAAIIAGADYIGLVFFPASPRFIRVNAAQILLAAISQGPTIVGVFVNPDDRALDETIQALPLNMIQLHGSEGPKRVAEIRARWGLPIMKAIGMSGPQDLANVEIFEETADWLLFDGRRPGSGQAFDWSLLADRRFRKPFMLSGGLNAANAGTAISMVKPDALDVSSGVESAPGRKDPGKISAFIKAVKNHHD